MEIKDLCRRTKSQEIELREQAVMVYRRVIYVDNEMTKTCTEQCWKKWKQWGIEIFKVWKCHIYAKWLKLFNYLWFKDGCLVRQVGEGPGRLVQEDDVKIHCWDWVRGERIPLNILPSKQFPFYFFTEMCWGAL